ncbi:unnamed protein product, partial [Medioppia subpectinata]
MCVSSGSRPMARITWYMNKKKVPESREFYSDDGNVTTSLITLSPVPDDNGGQLVCSAQNIH